MMHKISIVMYHYVRDTEHTEFPGIKALPIHKFREQLDYIQKYYTVITMGALLDAVVRQKELPARACLLTFDDGLKDHVQNVLPILKKLQLQGSFFAPGKAVMEKKILDVQKIQHILASIKDTKVLFNDICQLIAFYSVQYNLNPVAEYVKKLAHASRFDSNEVVFIKRLLQHALPMAARNAVVNELFTKYVTKNEGAYFDQLYMNTTDIAELQNAGMFVGSHGFEHDWLGTMSKTEQEKQIDLSIQFLNQINCNTQEWVLCYPYGSYNEILLKILRSKKCALGFTTHVAIADLSKNNPLLLPRLDTTDLPTASTAPINEWTKQA